MNLYLNFVPMIVVGLVFVLALGTRDCRLFWAEHPLLSIVCTIVALLSTGLMVAIAGDWLRVLATIAGVSMLAVAINRRRQHRSVK